MITKWLLSLSHYQLHIFKILHRFLKPLHLYISPLDIYFIFFFKMFGMLQCILHNEKLYTFLYIFVVLRNPNLLLITWCMSVKTRQRGLVIWLMLFKTISTDIRHFISLTVVYCGMKLIIPVYYMAINFTPTSLLFDHLCIYT